MWRAAVLGGRGGPRPSTEILCAFLTLIAVLPVWLFRWFPTQDGPSHLYNAYVLSHYYDAASTLVRMYLDVNLRPFPNGSSQR